MPRDNFPREHSQGTPTSGDAPRQGLSSDNLTSLVRTLLPQAPEPARNQGSLFQTEPTPARRPQTATR